MTLLIGIYLIHRMCCMVAYLTQIDNGNTKHRIRIHNSRRVTRLRRDNEVGFQFRPVPYSQEAIEPQMSLN